MQKVIFITFWIIATIVWLFDFLIQTLNFCKENHFYAGNGCFFFERAFYQSQRSKAAKMKGS